MKRYETEFLLSDIRELFAASCACVQIYKLLYRMRSILVVKWGNMQTQNYFTYAACFLSVTFGSAKKLLRVA